MAPIPKASSENCPLMKYIIARPNTVPKATGNSRSGMVFQLRKHRKMTSSTMISDHMMLFLMSFFSVHEL